MSEAQALKFEEDAVKERLESEQLLVYLGDFDGPIDMLLSLARDQKVDLTKISILALANQYLDFVDKARELRLELAADYLVMAAWLAYLKSRLLIPQEDKKQAEPSAQDLADALQFQLRRLEAMRKVTADLFNLPRLGFNVFGRGEPEGLKIEYIAKYEMTLYDLLKSYGDIKVRQSNSVYKLNPVKLFSLEEAIDRMETMLGKIPQDWVSLFMFLPSGVTEKIVKRSAVASTFGGALEMAKRGLLQIQQDKNYGPIYIRRPVAKQDGDVAEQVSPPAPVVEETGLSEEEILQQQIDIAEAEAAAAEAAAAEAELKAQEEAVEHRKPLAMSSINALSDDDEAEDSFEALSDFGTEAETTGENTVEAQSEVEAIVETVVDDKAMASTEAGVSVETVQSGEVFVGSSVGSVNAEGKTQAQLDLEAEEAAIMAELEAEAAALEAAKKQKEQEEGV